MGTRAKLRSAAGRFARGVREHYLLALLAFVLSAAIMFAYYLLGGTNHDIWPNIAAEFVTNLWTFVILYIFIVRRGVSLPGMPGANDTGALVEFFSTHEDVDWGPIISGAHRIDIVVHYYDRWVREHFDEFKAVFERGGTVRIILPDPANRQVMGIVQREFFPDHTLARIQEKVRDTAKFLRNALSESGSAKASVDALAFPHPLHYAAVITDLRHVYLSYYEQFRSPTIRSQVFHLDLARDAGLERYWKGTIEEFTQQSVALP